MGENSAKSRKNFTENDSNEEDNLLKHAEISVLESEKRANGTLNLRDYYTVYLIETKATDPEFYETLAKLSTVWRRYTEFEQLRDYLEVTYPYIVLPPLPEKKVMFGWQKVSSDTFDPDFIDRRRAGLENFLLRLASHTVLSWDKHFTEFLQQEDKWRESYKSNVAVRLKRPDPKFEALKTYSNNLHSNLYNLLKARSRVAEKTYTVHKLHSNYGRVFSEWSAVEKDMGDALQKTGHYLDSLASSIDGTLEDEELLADQLKEYLFFAISLQNVCKNQETFQLQVENAEDFLEVKNSEKQKVLQGKFGLMSRLFGAVDTEEVRELKVNVLDKQIAEANGAVNTSKEQLANFCEEALLDIERFQNQKVVDLKDTFAMYAILQLKTAKKGLQTWVQIRECLQTIP